MMIRLASTHVQIYVQSGAIHGCNATELDYGIQHE